MSTLPRIKWLDIAKGLSIILVVMGHSGDVIVNHYLAWFRMPLFFFLSGMLFKPIEPKFFGDWTKKKTIRMIIPYLVYGIIIILIFFPLDLILIIKGVIKLLYGGIILVGPHAVFWFITCLLITQVIFGFISRYKLKMQIIIVIGLYILAHVLTHTELREMAFPWNIDVVLITLTYYSIGYYTRNIIIKNIKKMRLFILSALMALTFIYLDFNQIYLYRLDLKYKIYNSILLDFIIPLSFIVFVCSISYMLSKLKISVLISWLGKHTITIMYLHIPVNIILIEFYGDYNLLLYTFFGILIPLIIFYCFNKFSVTRKIFLGV